MNNNLFVSFYAVLISIALMAPAVLQLIEIDAGTWSVVNSSEEESQNGYEYELHEQLFFNTSNEINGLSNEWIERSTFRNDTTQASTFNNKIVLPPPESTL